MHIKCVLLRTVAGGRNKQMMHHGREQDGGRRHGPSVNLTSRKYFRLELSADATTDSGLMQEDAADCRSVKSSAVNHSVPLRR